MTVRDITSLLGSGGVVDPYFENVSLLLQCDGTNGSQNNTFVDSSSNNFTITRNGNTTQGTFSPYGNLWSNYINGTGNSLTFTATSAMSFTGDMTVEAWVYLNSYAGSSFNECTLLSLRTGSSTGSQFDWGRTGGSIAAGAVDWWNYGASVCQGSVGDIPLNQWAHVAYVRSGSGTNNCKVYVNGVLKAQGTYTGTVGVSSGTCYIGNSMFDQPMNGYVSNLRVTNTAVYTTAFTPPTTPLTAVSGTSLLTCQSNRFKDNSSNNFTLTVNGNTSVQRFSPFNPTVPYSESTIGGSGYFDGSGDWLALGTQSILNVGTGDITLECWVNFPAVSTTHSRTSIFSPIEANFSSGIIIALDGATQGSSGLRVAVAGTSQIYATAIKPDTWHHIAVVRASGTVKAYLNGTSVLTFTASGSLGSPNLNIGALKATDDFYSDYFKGYISNLRIVKGTAVYTTSFTPPTSPLTAITNTSLLCNFTNAGIPDAAMMNDLETVGNAQVSTSVKKYGTGSLYFDGNGDYLYSPWIPGLEFNAGNFTIEFWVYINSGNSLFCWSVDWHYGMTWNYAGSAGNKVGVWASTNGSSWDIFNADGGGNGISTGTISTGTWTHVAWVRNGSSWVLYLNGTSAWTGTSSATIVTRNTDKFRIGGPWPGAGPGDFNGYIDDFRITKGYARYTANFTPPTQALPTN